MKNIKISLAMLLSITMLFSLCACNGGSSLEDSVVDNKKETGEFKETTLELDECKIVVLGADKITGLYDKSVIRVWFDITNTSDDTCTTNGLYMFSATQDNLDLASAVVGFEFEGEEQKNRYLDIRPSVTIRTVEEYSFDENGGIVKVSFYDFNSDKESQAIEFDPTSLPGAPKDKFIPQTIKDPQWTKDLKTEGVIERDYLKYAVNIDGCDFTKARDSSKVIRVYFTFKNTSTVSQEFNCKDWYPNVYQDGIQIKYPDDIIGEDVNNTIQIEPEESVSLAYCYELISDSPVEVELADDDFDNIIGIVYKVK